MAKVKDITGQRFGRLVAKELGGTTRSNKRLWVCECDCGATVSVVSSRLRSGHTQSCGCLKLERLVARSTKHLMCDHPAYKAYHSAKQRCNYTKDKEWHNYGGRGIKFSLPSFEVFWEKLGPLWYPGATLDRIDTNGHYELNNVQWATLSQQSRTRRKAIWITARGKTQHLCDWAVELGISYEYARLKYHERGAKFFEEHI